MPSGHDWAHYLLLCVCVSASSFMCVPGTFILKVYPLTTPFLWCSAYFLRPLRSPLHCGKSSTKKMSHWWDWCWTVSLRCFFNFFFFSDASQHITFWQAQTADVCSSSTSPSVSKVHDAADFRNETGEKSLITAVVQPQSLWFNVMYLYIGKVFILTCVEILELLCLYKASFISPPHTGHTTNVGKHLNLKVKLELFFTQLCVCVKDCVM